MTLNIKVLVVSILVGIAATEAGDLAAAELGWDPQRVTSLIWSIAFIWVYLDLERVRARLASIRERAQTVTNKIEAARR